MDTTARPGRPPRMSRDKIAATAIEILADEGYAKLSMRRLADRLGTSPMGIYYYFESKHELLGYLFSRHDGVADYRRSRTADDPYDRVVQAAETLVRFLEAQPWALAGIVDGHVEIEEFTRRHLRDLADGVRDLGLRGADATEALRGVWRIVIGAAVLGSAPESGRAGAGSPVPCAETIECFLAGRLARAAATAAE
ncbi:mycofactocin system transcriptional regulator [Tsukamurella paurometabola]|uniref:Mycofactocin system transcriptional regulator n=2 Tax=Tsukamurella paurometabola TaxID=2061 RepID=A0A3P8KER9_TSUPA|nr:mycofactocin system transcriptional regulator [Tsukamurella paurometabola]